MLKQFFFASMILQGDKVIKLCLEDFFSGKLIHFSLNRKSLVGPVRDLTGRKKPFFCSAKNAETENLNLVHACI